MGNNCQFKKMRVVSVILSLGMIGIGIMGLISLIVGGAIDTDKAIKQNRCADGK